MVDGPLELWEASQRDPLFEGHFKDYLEALRKLHGLGASTAGYIDKPGSDLSVRMLEIGRLKSHELEKAGPDYRPFQGIKDMEIFASFLAPNERSAVFQIQSKNAKKYPQELALHFFYLNVGRTPEGRPYLARVEIPAWVADSPQMLDELHAVLVQQ